MKNIKYFIGILIGLGLASCGNEYLSPDPISAIGGDSFYSNDQELEAGLVNMYDGIQGKNSTRSEENHSIQIEYQVTEMRSDNTRTKSSEGESAQFENYSIEATNGVVADYYRSFYNIIFRANTVLGSIENASEAMAPKIEGEAKFVRAYAYFNLVRLFGDIPLLDRVIAPAEEDMAYTRVATSEVYELIVSDLQMAVSTLENGNKYRATRAAAQALLAKVYLTIGNYSEATSLCQAVMSSGFSLEPEFKDVFYNELNDEIIWSINYEGDDAVDSQNMSAEWLNAVGRSSGLNYVTAEAKEALDLMGGNRTAYSYRVDQAQPTQHQVVKYLPNGDDDLGIDPTSGNPLQAGNDWIILRYSDVLLMYVEAVMAGGDLVTDASAITAFRQVRDRAGITTPVVNISKQELLDERRVELAFENQRLFDLMRFGVAQEVLSAFSDANGYGFSATDLLLPIPQREINLSKGKLAQNPGY